MKTLKPQRLGVLTRTFEHDGKCFLVTTVLVGFAFDAPNVPLHEAALWQSVTSRLDEGHALDEAMSKPRGEVLVTGAAYPPGGKAGIGCAVRLVLGDVDKQLYVVGDRTWGATGPTAPTPFTRMPVSWSRAFGGSSFADNPLGVGLDAVSDEDGAKRTPLPNVENPKALIKARGDKPTPVGFGPIDARSAIRRKRGGTYDKKWLESVFPGLPKDFSFEFFNVAPADQQLSSFFAGGESFTIENMHPTLPKLDGRVPELVARCFVTRRGPADAPDDAGTRQLEEVPTRLDTVHLFPEDAMGVAFYRGVVEVLEDDAVDIRELMIACENAGEPKPRSHYEAAFANRLDKDKSPLFYLRDTDLLPPLPEGRDPMGLDEVNDLPALMAMDGLLAKNLRNKAQLELERLRDICRQHDVDPDEHLPREVPPAEEDRPNLDALDTYIEEKKADADKARADAEQKQEELMAEARRMCAEHDIDFDAVVEAGKKDGGGPPKFRAEDELQKLHDMKELSANAGMPIPSVDERLNDPLLFEKLKAAELQLREAYRRNAHSFPVADRLDADASGQLAVRLGAAVEAKESLNGSDFTGATLAGIRLPAADLAGIFLERAVLTGADLAGANLRDAVLVRADLTGAQLAGACLAGANLAEADLTQADLSGCDLTGANLTGATLAHVKLDGATLDNAFLFGAKITQGSFVGMRATRLFFHELDLSGADLSGAELPDCIFVDTNLSDAKFRGAVLDRACFVTVNADRATFEDARCSNLRVVHGSSMAEVNFRNAELAGANLRDTPMRGANLQNASAAKIDLSGCDLSGGALEQLRAPDALLVRTNLTQAKLTRADLMQSILQKANIEGADFSGANLFRGDFAKIRGNVGTKFDGANMKFIRFVNQDRGQGG